MKITENPNRATTKSQPPPFADYFLSAPSCREKSKRIAWLYILAATCQLAIAGVALTEWLNWRFRFTENQILGIWMTWGFALIFYMIKALALFIGIAYGLISATLLLITAIEFRRFNKTKRLELLSFISCLLAPAGTLVGIYSAHFTFIFSRNFLK
ncbi:hypothetical protein ACDH70_16455 [Xanthomonas axonopodis pv. poinsettiicola]|uniref:hypothetical protein n=1 Tax=Xanthomonas TaxID=338 RepID=UPI001E4C26D7|nr:hypothetical protein [Xanthomonas codiaei]MCC8536168.1 hypothetical protein [Xanthomonas codiaei]